MLKRVLLILSVGFVTTVYSVPGYDVIGDKQNWRQDEQSNSSNPVVRNQRQTNGDTYEIEVIDFADLQNKETNAISPFSDTQGDQQLKAEINSILTVLGASKYQGKTTENKNSASGPVEDKIIAGTESYDYSNRYYDQDDSENKRLPPPPHHERYGPSPHRGDREPPLPPHRRGPYQPYPRRGHRRPPPPTYDDYRSDYYDHPRPPPRWPNDDRQTRQSSRYPPPPGHRPPRPYRGAPPDHRGPPDRHHRGPPPPPRHRGGPPDRWHDRGPPHRGGPPDRWHEGGPPHRGGQPDRWRDEEPPHRGGQGHRPRNEGPPPRFDDRPPPPPSDDSRRNQEENDDNEYMLDVRFADEQSAQTTKRPDTNPSESVSFLLQATPVTPENT